MSTLFNVKPYKFLSYLKNKDLVVLLFCNNFNIIFLIDKKCNKGQNVCLFFQHSYLIVQFIYLVNIASKNYTLYTFINLTLYCLVLFFNIISCSSIDYYLFIIEFGLDILDFKSIVLDLKYKIKHILKYRLSDLNSMIINMLVACNR